MIDRTTSKPFSAIFLYLPPTATLYAREIIKHSRISFCTPIRKIENDGIRKWNEEEGKEQATLF
jgi:hypothetical protein